MTAYLAWVAAWLYLMGAALSAYTTALLWTYALQTCTTRKPLPLSVLACATLWACFWLWRARLPEGRS